MSSSSLPSSPSLSRLAAYLSARREAILSNWRTACEANVSLPTGMDLAREEFNNKVPLMLNILEQRLRGEKEEANVEEANVEQKASEHGLHRWHKGYSLQELLKEMKHLHHILLDELQSYWKLHQVMDPLLIVEAYQQVSYFSGETMEGSVKQFHSLYQVVASTRVEALEKAHDEMSELLRQRGEILRSSSHDLRSSFGVIQGSASILNMDDLPEQERKEMLDMLNRNLMNTRNLISQLMDLARLEAGQEKLEITSFDAAQLLKDIVEGAQPLAQSRGLVLQADGPPSLSVESDAIKIQRIVQNLLLNALQHTPAGWVSVSWMRESDSRWIISVQDSGPGLPTTGSALLASQLLPVAESGSSLGQDVPETTEVRQTDDPRVHSSLTSGEGLGLSIVKGLCELLNANMDIETRPGQGTLFRIRLPFKTQVAG